ERIRAANATTRAVITRIPEPRNELALISWTCVIAPAATQPAAPARQRRIQGQKRPRRRVTRTASGLVSPASRERGAILLSTRVAHRMVRTLTATAAT